MIDRDAPLQKCWTRLTSNLFSLGKILVLNKSRAKSIIPYPWVQWSSHAINILLSLDPSKKFRVGRRVVVSTVNLVFCFGQKLRFWTWTTLNKNCWKHAKIQIGSSSVVFGRFLSSGWSDWILVFCSVSGILRHKFRIPTKGTLKTKIFKPVKGFLLSLEA